MGFDGQGGAGKALASARASAWSCPRLGRVDQVVTESVDQSVCEFVELLRRHPLRAHFQRTEDISLPSQLRIDVG